LKWCFLRIRSLLFISISIRNYKAFKNRKKYDEYWFSLHEIFFYFSFECSSLLKRFRTFTSFNLWLNRSLISKRKKARLPYFEVRMKYESSCHKNWFEIILYNYKLLISMSSFSFTSQFNCVCILCIHYFSRCFRLRRKKEN